MALPPFDKQERDQLLTQYHDAARQYSTLREQDERAKAKPFFNEMRQLKERYFERLPRIVMAASPFSGRPLVRTFDPFGFDGLWWHRQASTEEPPPGPHFCVLRGAVHLHDQPFDASGNEVNPGPEVPYVIPRLLEMDGMVMVIGEVEMEPGYTAYPCAYFAERRPTADELTADWGRSTYTYTLANGETGWTVPTDPWDFELRPWIEQGKVRWCVPGSGNEQLATGSVDECPYLDLAGVREERLIRGHDLQNVGVPDGQPIFPID